MMVKYDGFAGGIEFGGLRSILDIKILPSLTDVNVHPTKAEIKFTDDRAVYNNIY